MSEPTVCRHCGYSGPADARYCARCGRMLVPQGTSLASSVERLLDDLSPRVIDLLGLVCLALIGVQANQLIVETGLFFSGSYALLAVGIGLGGAYLGWGWARSLPSRERLTRVLVALVGMVILLEAVGVIDRILVSILSDGGDWIVSDIPGVRFEASGDRRVHIVSDAPPYWLLVTVYAILTAVAGRMVCGRYRKRRAT